MSTDTNNLLAPMDFGDLEPVEVSVTIGGKPYVLREASCRAAIKYRNAIVKSTKFGANGKPVGMDGMADSEPILVSECLYLMLKEKDTDTFKRGPLVQLNHILDWPQRIQKGLFERLKQISQLEDETTKELANQENEQNGEQLDAPLDAPRGWAGFPGLTKVKEKNEQVVSVKS